jgi:hypothetical protein
MSSRDQIIQRMARIYREEQGSADIDLSSFAEYLISHGVKPPTAPTARELMAKAAKRALTGTSANVSLPDQINRSSCAYQLKRSTFLLAGSLDVSLGRSPCLKQDIRRDQVTGRPYHGWQAVPHSNDARTGQLSFTYIDTDEAPREPMKNALLLKVSMMIDDGVQVTFDAEHWNRVNPEDEPIVVDELLDLRDQVQWRVASRDDEGIDDDGGGDPDSRSV